MDTLHKPVTINLEETILRFFSPNGLMTVVLLVILMALCLGGAGIEHRTVDVSAADPLQATVSPLLHSNR